MRYLPFGLSILGVFVFPFTTGALGGFAWVMFTISAALTAIGVRDILQEKHAVRRNYPILANIRYLLEEIRPEIRQYFLESETDGTPFNRSKRAIVYQRAKRALDKRPFGTQLDVYSDNFEWLTHSMMPAHIPSSDFRVRVGGPDCLKPYDLSLFNISAMSFGSLSANAIRALNKGAKLGGFAHDTGEGGFSPYHREFGGDIIWELGSGYFGCRNADGSFSEEMFAKTASTEQIKMIEIKLSQGAKPGHGGVLPAAKISAEIALTRGVPLGVDCVSPASHSAFSTPIELMHFIAKLRELSGGKPVGFKLCIGNDWEFAAMCKAMLETGITPDFIVVDGKEGGTGAAPLEFTDHVGTPLREGLTIVRNCLVGAGLKDRVKLGASGRIVTAFDMARVLALGADWCNAARGYMFAIGCIQSLACHTDRCPTGVATQDPIRQRALVVGDKAERVRHFHDSTLEALREIVAAAGLQHPSEITARHVMKRVSQLEVRSFAEVYAQLSPGELIQGTRDPAYQRMWAMADAQTFAPRPLTTAANDATEVSVAAS
ncbi:FMN-binding glutamate synthase family protein [Phreatobacter aquaticus]|uniref:FMN-binding glutamate synthase family protein n=1 Tax=Phreatobacter aquaticus TaxID=2570229 RepID=A0A4D7QHI4_9HYPH|nr:FMN-binding glutamate synthase family protein [Phreatobacter aquaticus]QCK86191.1 FMN-binding glutamate synthase family protein [Phreatobacter aquaticus]